MLNRKQGEPLYEQLKNNIKEKIEKGEWQPDEQLPSERELGEIYQVSRITVRQAIALAEQEGLVTRVHGIGTFVSSQKIGQRLNEVENFQTTVEQLGLVAKTKLLKADAMASNFHLSKILDIAMTDMIFNIDLLGYGNDSPIVYYKSYLPIEIGQSMLVSAKELTEKNEPFSTLDLFKYQNQLIPTHIEQTFEATIASDGLDTIFQLDEGFPLLKVTSIIYENSTPLEYKESYYRGDKYKFYVTRLLDS